MKKPFIAALAAAPLLMFSSLSFSAEPVGLTEIQMDGISAGSAWKSKSFNKTFSFNLKQAEVWQFNASPVTVVQVSVLNFDGGNNYAAILSGNWSSITQ